MLLFLFSQGIKEAEKHLAAVTKERSYYRNICEESKKNIQQLFTSAGEFQPPVPGTIIPPLHNNTTIHYCFDMAQQVLKIS